MEKQLNGFPYHPYLYLHGFSKEEFERIRNIFLTSGLLIDEEYNVFVNPKFGAFFYNTKYQSIQEEIRSCQDMLIMNFHCYVPQDELLEYIDKGYEFVIGPCVKIFENDNDSLNGIYCTNYNKLLKTKR